jgi:putative colanic acid biosynthesis UDP-glucose lipid carrier transferase
VTIAWFVVVLLVVLIAFLSKIAFDVSRVWFTTSAALAYLLLLIVRLLIGYVQVSSRKNGERILFVALVGANDLAQATIDRMQENTWAGYRVVNIFSSIEVASSFREYAGMVVEPVEKLLPTIERARAAGAHISQVWITLPLSAEIEIQRITDELRASSVDVCLVPDSFGMQVLTGSAINVAELSIINISDIRLRGTAEFYKRVFDRFTSFMVLILLAPVFLTIAIAIKVNSTGPVFFRQLRYGMDGREITILKFRSMFVHDHTSEVQQATRDDFRVTRVGNFLRKYSLDELPQFYNVLKGSMSIVGPRPHAVSHNEEYRGKIDGYMMRHQIKPGITGWAQINGWRGETDTLEKMEKRIQFDLEYIRNWSAWLDMKIIFLTILRGFSGRDVY